LLIILDANEYIFGLGARRERACEQLLGVIVRRSSRIAVRIPRLIVNEVRRNLTPEAFKEFIALLTLLGTFIDEDSVVSFESGIRYEAEGLKPADAFIAAYTEWVGAEWLISENRHFLSRQADLPFRVLPAEKAVRLVS
jgi:hypothetical protein